MGQPEYSDLLSKWDEDLKNGHDSLVSEELSKINFAEIPNNHRRDVATIMRRLGNYFSGLKIISPLVLDQDSQPCPDAKNADIAEYAVLLQKIGLHSEAYNHLSAVNSETEPKALLYKAFCLFSQWDRANAIPYLAEYVDCGTISDYDRTVGMIHLLESYVFNKQYREALQLGTELIKICKGKSYKRFYANCLELLAQVSIAQDDFVQAETYLHESAESLKPDTNDYLIHIKKWLAYVEGVKSGDLDSILQVKDQAQQLKKYEVIREIDYLSLKIQFNPDIFNRLIYGSIHSKFQNKLLDEFKGMKRPTPFTEINPEGEKTLDPSQGLLDDKTVLPKGKKVHQLVTALLFDHYHPLQLGNIHALLFKDEPFNIFKTPNKIHQLISKTQAHLKKENLPLKILKENDFYSLEYPDNLKIIISYKKEIP